MPIILLRSHHTDSTDFYSYIKTEDVISYAQYQLDREQTKPRPINLKSLLKQAQMEFLSYESHRSKNTFLLMTNNIHSFDWNNTDRKIIFYSLLRLAQMEKNLQKQKLYLQEAFIFSIGLKLDLQVFPPPLVKKYFDIKNSISSISIELENIFPDHEIILINGKQFFHKDKVSLPYGTYRVTGFSSSHKKWSQILSLSQLVSKKITTPPLMEGTCQNPLFKTTDNDLQKKQIQVLFPNFCIWNSIIQKSLNKEMENNLSTDIKMINHLKAPNQDNPWIEEAWIWIGAAVILGATSIYLLNKKQKKNNIPQLKPQIKRKTPNRTSKIKYGF